MKVAFPKRRQLSVRRNEPRLWPFGAALAAGFAIVVFGLTALTWLAWLLLHRPSPPHPGTISLHDAVSVLQLVFASVAGSGALVALIVAYRKQKIAEADSSHDRTRVFNERFATIATQLGEESPAVRLAAVHAMAGLADDWESNRQTCIDVLCAYLRMPYEPDPGEYPAAAERLTFRANREVRHSVIRIITCHLRDDAPVSWQGWNFDFTGVIFDGGDFSRALFTDGTVDFTNTQFADGTVDFAHAAFIGGTVHFAQAAFTGGTVDFSGAVFAGGTVDFARAKFVDGLVAFNYAQFADGLVDFNRAQFTGGAVHFTSAQFSSSVVVFNFAGFSGSSIVFAGTAFSGGTVGFTHAAFIGGTVHFAQAAFTGGTVDFSSAEFIGGTVHFNYAAFTGGVVPFNRAQFTGGTIDFSRVIEWSHPPRFDEPVPAPVKLPSERALRTAPEDPKHA